VLVRSAVLATVVWLSSMSLAVADDVQAGIRKPTAIPPQPLGVALQALAKERGFQVVFVSKEVDSLRTRGARGELTVDEALRQLLEGTGLTYKSLGEDGVSIVPVETAGDQQKAGHTDDSKPSGAPSSRASETSPLRMARTTEAQDTSASADDTARAELEEIVVTAQKKPERLLDVPISISVITADDINRRGLVSGEDYLRGVPGANQVTDAFGGSSIVIRGIETSVSSQNFSSGPTTATYFGETPTTSSAGLAGNMNVDLKLVDVERVEVLRGPQGTAFGNASLGGAVRTLPIAPMLGRFEGRVAASYSGTSGSGGSNNMIQAVGNIPLIENRLALRASAFRYDDSGFYRNVAGSDAAFRAAAVTPFGAEAFAVDENDVGASQFTGGRIAALFQASEDLRFTLTWLKQKTEIDGAMIAGTGGLALSATGRYDQAVLRVAPEHVIRGEEGGVSDTDIDLANAVMEYNLGWGQLLATLSRIESDSTNVTPYTWCCFAWPISTLAPSQHEENVGEIRLATQLEGPWDFLLGLYAEKLDDAFSANYIWHGDVLAFGQRFLGDYIDERTLKQKAAFGEVSWEFAPRWTLTGGLRAYDYERTGRVDLVAGPFTGVDSSTSTAADASGTTFKGNLSFKPSDNTLLYAGWSQGFRLGSPQPGLPATCDGDGDGVVDGSSGLTLASTRSTDSDEVDNYELGVKFSLFDRRLTLTADVYRIDWSGVPIRVNVGTCGSYTANAGEARSEGVELQARFQVTPAFRLDVGGSRSNAELTRDAPGLFVPAFKGDRLPGSPKVNANLGLQYELNLGQHRAFIRADSIYVGRFFGDLQESPVNEAGGYVKVDATGRVAFGDLAIDVFARNLTNRDDYTLRNLSLPSHGYRLRPRTIGVQLSYQF
jgi:iron complex outermembrane recepter protein